MNPPITDSEESRVAAQTLSDELARMHRDATRAHINRKVDGLQSTKEVRKWADEVLQLLPESEREYAYRDSSGGVQWSQP